MKKYLVRVVSAVLLMVVALAPALRIDALGVEVTSEEELVAAALNGGEIVLANDIEITKPVILQKDTTITSKEGNNYVLDGSNMTLDGKNGSIITVSKSLNLKNVTLTNALKYGVQAYDGGNVVLDGVTIKNSKWGAILVNGGQVTIKNLTMNANAWGVEFAKGENVTGDPALVMNGTLTATSQSEAITVDESQVEKFVVKNEDTSANKIELQDNFMVVKNDDGEVVVKSKALAEGLKVEINGVEEETKVKEETPVTTKPVITTQSTITTQTPEKNPNTADNAPLYLIGLVAGMLGIGLCVKKIKA